MARLGLIPRPKSEPARLPAVYLFAGRRKEKPMATAKISHAHSGYVPTAYDIQLEELIAKIGELIQSQYEAGEVTRALVFRQRVLHILRTPEYVKHLEKIRGVA